MLLNKGVLFMQRMLSYIRKAVEDYNMIEDGDKIAVRIIWWKRLNNIAYGFKSITKILF